MNVEKCELFNLTRKRDLYYILRTTPKEVALILHKYRVCINDGKRLLEKPCQDLKRIQRRLLYKLYDIEFPNYVFSGVKGKSALDNALQHINSTYILKLDMSKFFPNTHREKVYQFFFKKLQMSYDVAKLCTDITTINYKEDSVKIDDGVLDFIKIKKIKNTNHLPSGTPTSQILSYLANYEMFKEIIQFCKNHNMICSIYVDDITLSTNRKISSVEEKEIKKIIKKYGQKISTGKTIRYLPQEYKKITGFVISPQKSLVIANKTKLKIKRKLKAFDSIEAIDLSNKNSILGLVNFAKLSHKDAYSGLLKTIKSTQANKF